MLKPVRRHLLACPHLPKGRSWKKCSCPIWVEGRIDGVRIRKSLDTANWEFAAEKILEMEARKEELKESSVADAVKDFIKDCHSRNLSPDTVSKFEQVLNPLEKFCTSRGVSTVRAIDLQLLRDFIQSLTDAGITKDKKIERLRTFGRHCEDMGWADGVPAKKLKKPVTRDAEVVPFTVEEWKAIRASLDLYPERNSFGHDNQARLRAFIYLLRYTGLRISDVTSLRPCRINNGRILIRTLKTGAPIYLPLPPFVLEAVAAIDKGTPYFFWSGEGKLKSCIGDWQRSIRRLFKLAEIKGHPHMFRYTMAIELLEKGVLVEHVAAILGNSPLIIYKHYAPWMPSRQKALDGAVMQVWGDVETEAVHAEADVFRNEVTK